MRVVTRALSMASMVSARPGPVPGGGGNCAHARGNRATNTAAAKMIGAHLATKLVLFLAFIVRPRSDGHRKASLAGSATAPKKLRDPRQSQITPTKPLFRFERKAKSSPRW